MISIQIYFQIHPKIKVNKNNKNSIILSHMSTNRNLLISFEEKYEN